MGWGGGGGKGGKQSFGIFHIPINYLVDNFNKLTQMAVIKSPYIQIQLVYIGSLPKVHKLRVCVPPPHTFWHLPTPLIVHIHHYGYYPFNGRLCSEAVKVELLSNTMHQISGFRCIGLMGTLFALSTIKLLTRYPRQTTHLVCMCPARLDINTNITPQQFTMLLEVPVMLTFNIFK